MSRKLETELAEAKEMIAHLERDLAGAQKPLPPKMLNRIRKDGYDTAIEEAAKLLDGQDCDQCDGMRHAAAAIRALVKP